MRPNVRAFDDLQERLETLLAGHPLSELDSATAVVIPSITFAAEELRKITAIEHYEERLFCLVLWLANPTMRVVFVSSVQIQDVVVDYYLSFLPDPDGARSRLSLYSLDDPEGRALSEKLLERPDALARIRNLIADQDRAFIVPFNVTEVERDVAIELGIPLYGPAPELIALGTKSGSRHVAKRAGVPLLPGAEDIHSVEELGRSIESLARKEPKMRSVVIKLNNGFSGQGNAVMDLASMRAPLQESPTIFCAEEETWSSYERKIMTDGAVVEQLVRHSEMASPSVQLRIMPGGICQVLSTHDQVLGGPDDQVYLGCRFPARSDYRALIQEHALSVGAVLAVEGVIGLFGLDFVVLPEGKGNSAYLSEINLRMGGTTHPFVMAQGVTGAKYDLLTGELIAEDRPKCYVASDNLKSHHYKGLTPGRVLNAVRDAGLGFNERTKTGVTLHLLGALEHYGKLGALCIAEDNDRASELYELLEETLEGVATSGRGASPER
jgi:pheganomycin biosynthesis PGM1-like protein